MDPLTENSAAMRIWRRGPTGSVAATWASLLVACAPGPRTLDPPPGDGAPDPAARLLEAVGFPDRESWDSRVLHLDASEIGGRTRLSALLRRSDRVRLGRPEGTEWGIQLIDGGGGEPCPVALYINGSRYGRSERPGSGVTLDDLIAPGAIAGLELHRGTDGPVIPGLDCGALLIWTLEADPVYGFLGDIIVRVRGAAADRVATVVLEPGGQEGRRDGRTTFFTVLPGAYEVHVLGADGRTLDVRPVRAWAFAESEVVLDLNDGSPDRERPDVP